MEKSLFWIGKNEENKYVLIHGYTGAMDVVTKSLYDKLKIYKKVLIIHIAFYEIKFSWTEISLFPLAVYPQIHVIRQPGFHACETVPFCLTFYNWSFMQFFISKI